ncbi:hypothetical protein DM860_009150 [Cuscuta australis]|uniref:Uncharacterized protein n=1 Tax=Cuscuta australis TaxID=267555 RepID=A0A328DFH1_9ASTE|nr:hypothetical protein DM860_009150 [Cuscuta australis]
MPANEEDLQTERTPLGNANEEFHLMENKAKDLIEKQVSAFSQTQDNTLYMLPSTPQCFGSNGSTGPEAVVAAERNAAILTAKAGARDPSAIPSICCIFAALQSTAGETFPSICRISAAL